MTTAPHDEDVQQREEQQDAATIAGSASTVFPGKIIKALKAAFG